MSMIITSVSIILIMSIITSVSISYNVNNNSINNNYNGNINNFSIKIYNQKTHFPKKHRENGHQVTSG